MTQQLPRFRGKRRKHPPQSPGLALLAAAAAALPIIMLLPIGSWFSRSLAACMIVGLLYAGALWWLLGRSSSQDAPPRLRLLWTAPLWLVPPAAAAVAFLATRPVDGKQAWSVCAVSRLIA
jgi:hypothetical protein